MVENFDKFDEWLAIHQSFTCKPLSLNISPLFETHYQFVKVLLVKFL